MADTTAMMSAPATDISGLRALTVNLLCKVMNLSEGMTADQVFDQNKQTLLRLEERLSKDGYTNCYEALLPYLRVGQARMTGQPVIPIGIVNKRCVYIFSSFGLVTHMREDEGVLEPLAGVPIPFEYPETSDDLENFTALQKLFGTVIKSHFLSGPMLAVVQYRLLRYAFMKKKNIGILPDPDYGHLTAAFDELKKGKRPEAWALILPDPAQLGAEGFFPLSQPAPMNFAQAHVSLEKLFAPNHPKNGTPTEGLQDVGSKVDKGGALESQRPSRLATALAKAGLASALPPATNELDKMDLKTRQLGDQIARGLEDLQVFEEQKRQANEKALEALQAKQYKTAKQWLDRVKGFDRDIGAKLRLMREAAEEKRALDEKFSREVLRKLQQQSGK